MSILILQGSTLPIYELPGTTALRGSRRPPWGELSARFPHAGQSVGLEGALVSGAGDLAAPVSLPLSAEPQIETW